MADAKICAMHSNDSIAKKKGYMNHSSKTFAGTLRRESVLCVADLCERALACAFGLVRVCMMMYVFYVQCTASQPRIRAILGL